MAKVAQGLADPMSAFHDEQLVVRRVVRRDLVGALEPRRRAASAQAVEAQASGGHDQPPGQRLRVPEPAGVPMESDERLLEHVLGVVGVDAERADRGEDEPLIAADELPPGLLVAGRRARHQVIAVFHS